MRLLYLYLYCVKQTFPWLYVARKVHNKNPNYEIEIPQTTLERKNNYIALLIR